MKKIIGVAVLGFGLVLSTLVSAQWQWLDGQGRKIYSDRPPPPSVPEGSILKGPNGKPYQRLPAREKIVRENSKPVYGGAAAPAADSKAVTSTGKTAAASSPKAAASGAKPNALDSALEKQKKEEEAKKEAARKLEAEKADQIKKADCQRVKDNLATINSGIRISKTNEKGERSFMDDGARSAEKTRLEGLQTQLCN